MPRRAIQFFAAAVLMLAAGIGSYAWINRHMALPEGTGVALIGGPFTLTDHNGRKVSEKDFLGRYMLVFFGFTFCPDICPTELQVMTKALDAMGADGEKIQPVFVSIDPDRDTPEVLKAYVENFGPRLTGLTGTAKEIAAIAKAYRVYYAKSGDRTSPGTYLMDHSSLIYLMGPDGGFVKHFTYTTDVARLTAGLKEAITSSR